MCIRDRLKVQRGIEVGTPEAKQLNYEVSAIYGLGNAATLFYGKPTASTVSMGSTYTPFEYSKLQYELKSTQQQLNEQRRLVENQQKTMKNQQKAMEDQQRQFEEAMRLIHNFQSRIDLLSGSNYNPSD